MVNLAKYPNPLRLFTQTRDSWFTKLVESQDIPIHIFTSIRDTQLGQLMFAIESHRLKKIRAGEDPGPSMLAGEGVTAFVPLFQTVKLFQEFLTKNEIGIELSKIKKDFLANEVVKEFKKNKKLDSEWFTSQEFDRLDELFIQAANVIFKVIIPIIGEKLELEGQKEIITKIREIDETFANNLFNMCDPIIYESILEKSWTKDEKDDKLRLISTDDEETPINLQYNDFHTRTNVLHSFILEVIRLIETGKKYSLEFEMIPHFLTLEHLILIPQPDKSRLPIIKHHLAEINKTSDKIPEIWDLLSLSYQAFANVIDPQQRMFQKVFKSIEKSFKQTARTFWKKMEYKLASDDKSIREEAEVLLAMLWCHFRVVQAQTKQLTREKEHSQHNYSYRAILRFEHMFWQPGKTYLYGDAYNSKFHFWSTYASIANKEIRSPKDSLNLYNQFDTLFKKTKVLTNKTQRKKFDVTLRDHKSIVQSILSYGIEGKDDSIYSELKDYKKKLENIIDLIEEEIENFAEISLEEERNALKSIDGYLNTPLPKQQQQITAQKTRPVRRLRS